MAKQAGARDQSLGDQLRTESTDLRTRNVERQRYMGAAEAGDEKFRWPTGPGSDRKPR